MGINLEEECRRYEQEMQGGRRRRIRSPPGHRVSAPTWCSQVRHSSASGRASSKSGRATPVSSSSAFGVGTGSWIPTRRTTLQVGDIDGDHRTSRAARGTSRRTAARASGKWTTGSCSRSPPKRWMSSSPPRRSTAARSRISPARNSRAASTCGGSSRAGTPVPMFPATQAASRRRRSLWSDRAGESPTPWAASAFRTARRTSPTWCSWRSGSSSGRSSAFRRSMLGGVEIGLSLSVGVLLGGLVCGWLRSMWPRFFGRIPGPDAVGLRIDRARWIRRGRRAQCRAGLRGRPAHERHQPADRRPASRCSCRISSASWSDAGFQDAPGRPARCLRRRRNCDAGAGGDPGGREESRALRSGYGVSYAVGNVLLALWGTVIVALL